MAGSGRIDVDVAIVGAGFAGIAAGRALRDAGVAARLLEVSDRPGGRALTETDTLGVPFDRGCAWLHQATCNPLRDLADQYGVRYARKMPTRFCIDGRITDPPTGAAIESFLAETFERVADAGRRGLDGPAADFMEAGHPWSPIARYLMTTINAVEPEHYSTAEAGAEEDLHEDWIVYPGLGRLATLAADGLPIDYHARVTGIRQEDSGVAVETAHGLLRARTVIITASTGVLSSGAIRFDPPLSPEKDEALAGLPMGHAEKIALVLDPEAMDLPENTYLSLLDSEDAFGFHLRPFGLPLAVAYTGGRLARQVADWSEDTAVAFARHRLAAALGGTVAERVRGGTRTRWRHSPQTAGSYSAARPGCHHLRHILAQPVAQRLFFAGEATDARSFATAHGAWQSGLRAAGEVLAAMAAGD